MTKTDCFAFDKRLWCCAILKESECRPGKCAFYKTAEQHKADVKKAEDKTGIKWKG